MLFTFPSIKIVTVNILECFLTIIPFFLTEKHLCFEYKITYDWLKIIYTMQL